jgi:cytochrome c-type biogenesis protein CcmE
MVTECRDAATRRCTTGNATTPPPRQTGGADRPPVAAKTVDTLPAVARQRGNPARLVIALSVAAVLAIFLLYTSIAGGGTPLVQPSELTAYKGEQVTLGGVVVGRPTGDAYAKQGLRFRVRDPKGKSTVTVVYRGSVPDLFRPDREVGVTGTLRGGVFVAKKDTLVTKCPSKYSPTTSDRAA